MHPLEEEYLELQLSLFKETFIEIVLEHGINSEKAQRFSERLEQVIRKHEQAFGEEKAELFLNR
ncbi:hypothetical protein [Mesobacillus zeae]|uniref:Uncharacterized protein n=1 Tax=Mesobacillus zeae TaxID=1917180 RepID=A0A398B1A8_9BACI|nr:hypothetical protein [Mesobacillus zeae]RID82678.1 hypothetical protein D1970_18265 [Mesobacillus zeae]